MVELGVRGAAAGGVVVVGGVPDVAQDVPLVGEVVARGEDRLGSGDDAVVLLGHVVVGKRLCSRKR